MKTLSVILIILSTSNLFSQTRTWTDVTYATKSSSNKLDMYLPATGIGPFPTIVIIHGGGFSGGDKGPESTYAKAMVSRGFAAACINYRLSGEAIFPAQIYDVKAAIRFLKANASTYSLDTNEFATMGESSGGGLASLAATSGGDTIVEDLTMGNSNYTSRVKAAVDISGPIDFLTMNKQWTELGVTTGMDYDASTSYASVLVGGAIQTKKVLCNEYNAETYITPDDGYFWLEYGTADNTIPCLQGKVFADSLVKVIPSSRVSLHIIAGAGHVDPVFFSSANYDSIARFLDTCFSASITAVRQGSSLPTSYKLNQNYPNPFNPTTNISFYLLTESFASLKVIDIIGREVATLVGEKLSSGNHSCKWNAAGMPSGIYFYRLEAGGFMQTKKLILLK